MAKRKIQIEQLKQIPGFFKEGKSTQEIADIFGVSKSTLGYWIKRMKNAGVKMEIKEGIKALDLSDLIK